MPLKYLPEKPTAKHTRPFRLLAGASFVLTAVTWLIVNEQRRRANIKIYDSIQRMPKQPKRTAASVWAVIRKYVVDPWSHYRKELTQNAQRRTLEIGVDYWPNLRHYTNDIELTGVEYNLQTFYRARKRIRQFRPQTAVIYATNSLLPFPDEYFDTVVTSLSLCSVEDSKAVLSEIRRVLKKDGRFLFLEHVRAENTFVAILQDWLTPLWSRLSSNCHLNRNTIAEIETAGFIILTRKTLSGAWGPVRPTIMGIAAATQQEAQTPTLLLETDL